jgi:hypothetical protein
MLLGKGADENGETCYRSYKLPNFYKEISDVLGIAVQTLKSKSLNASVPADSIGNVLIRPGRMGVPPLQEKLNVLLPFF